MLIGIDFDNTIAGYDALFATLAVEEGLFEEAPASKRELRDELRRRPDGETLWRRLQTRAYGPRMAGAVLYEGIDRFLTRCRTADHEVCIVSHKTRYANFEPDGTDLRRAAFAWMEAQGFFSARGLGLSPDQIFFEDTRSAKVGRIAELGCSAFVDDLEEVFREPDYPAAAQKILFDPHDTAGEPEGVTKCRNWDQIGNVVFRIADTDG